MFGQNKGGFAGFGSLSSSGTTASTGFTLGSTTSTAGKSLSLRPYTNIFVNTWSCHTFKTVVSFAGKVTRCDVFCHYVEMKAPSTGMLSAH